MGEIDRQRVSAVKKLQELGMAWYGGAWQEPNYKEFLAEADAMHALLVKRADDLEGSADGSPEDAELASIIDVVEAYEAKRWPLGKIPGGKG
jgi:hypothetical protein